MPVEELLLAFHSEAQLWLRQPRQSKSERHVPPSAMAVTLSVQSLKEHDVLFSMCAGVSLSDGFDCSAACRRALADVSRKPGGRFLGLILLRSL